jgi:hypothetical protein
LSTQAEPEDWFLRCQSESNQIAFGIEIRIQANLISALSTAPEHETFEACSINRQLVPGVGMNVEALDTNFGKHFGEKTRLIHIPMLDEENFFHIGNLTTLVCEVKQKKAASQCISALPSWRRIEKLRSDRPDCRNDISHHAQTHKLYANCHR